jgi:hypothetical protein
MVVGAACLIRWEIPRLCRGGNHSLTVPGVRAGIVEPFCTMCAREFCKPAVPHVLPGAGAFDFGRDQPPLRGPRPVKPPALPEDTYLQSDEALPKDSCRSGVSSFWDACGLRL